MTRRSAILSSLVALTSSAQDRSEIHRLTEPLASALSSGDAGLFMQHVSSDASDYGRLRDNVRGLVEQAAITSSINVVKMESGAAELDWYMELRSRATETVIERRRGVVKIQHDGKIVTSVVPVDFFAPAKLG
jgi:hypothetical protein